ncbi:type II toxin-antitoxin system RelE/ParE family toxin [Dolichospermum sp. ST_sed3]|nr:type II toxin-antitoxin system RelE/ParE family toxin [Dolichospermum sp. ST_sed3]
MNYKIRISAEAENDINEAFLWYEYNQIGLGDDFIRNIEESFQSISKNPLAFLKIHRRIRRCLVHKYPYGIYYLNEDNNSEALIIGVIHFKRSSRIWKQRTKKIS